MKLSLRIFPIFCVYMLLISATCINSSGPSVNSNQSVSIINENNLGTVKPHRLNFFRRLFVKFYLKKNKFLDDNRADKMASTALWLGIGACALLVLGLVIPSGIVFLGSIPAGIAAMITGGSAVRNRTSLIGKAKTGKALGLGALIAFGVVLIIGVILLASLDWN